MRTYVVILRQAQYDMSHADVLTIHTPHVVPLETGHID